MTDTRGMTIYIGDIIATTTAVAKTATSTITNSIRVILCWLKDFHFSSFWFKPNLSLMSLIILFVLH